MKVFNIVIVLTALAAFTSTGYAFTVLNGYGTIDTSVVVDDRVILGHRIGSNGQEILVYAK